MNAAHPHRDELRRLADDLAWLEDHCRRQPELAPHAAHLRMAAALTRNVVGPALESPGSNAPLFVCVVGGAGAGKSTIINFLAGAVVAEANPQAGFTRHPTAFLPAASAARWPSTLGFLGSLTRIGENKPADFDEDVYQVKRIPAPLNGNDPLEDFVLWDCPDMTTWAAGANATGGYVSRLMEIVGLCDAVVYVASDERYNDEIPTQFLHHIIRAGKAVIVCLTKMREADEQALVEHFRQEVLGRLPAPGGEIPPIPCVAVPNIPPETRRDPAGRGASHRVHLLNQLLVICPSPQETRFRTLRNAMIYLETAGDGLMDVARRDLIELESWRQLVDAGRDEFEQRYRREFLGGETFRRFDRTRDQLLEMLELPGPLRIVGTVLAVLRWPYRTARDFVAKLVKRPEMPSLSEQTVCQTAMGAWLDGLQAESLRRTASHPAWKQITQTFDSGLKNEILDGFGTTFRNFTLQESDELDRAARAVPDRFMASPALLGISRLAVLFWDLSVLGVVLHLAWPPTWWWLLLVPLSLSLSRQLTEFLASQLIEVQRNRVRNRRIDLVRESLSGPLCAKLAAVPVRGGSTLEKLRDVLTRIPKSIQVLGVAVRSLTTSAPTSGSPS